MNLILHDGTSYEIIGFEPEQSITMVLQDQNELMTVWSNMTDENLSEFWIEEFGDMRRCWNYKMRGLRTNDENNVITAEFLLKHDELSREYEMIQELKNEIKDSFDNVTRDRETTDRNIEDLVRQNEELSRKNTELERSISELSDSKDMLEECLMEMSEIVYA